MHLDRIRHLELLLPRFLLDPPFFGVWQIVVGFFLGGLWATARNPRDQPAAIDVLSDVATIAARFAVCRIVRVSVIF